MASEDALGSPDDGLELERIAVGPYCVFDDFRLPPSPPTAMEDPMMATNFPFGNMREPPWQVHDELGWTDWMTYDPAAASQNPQSVEPKPATDQGPAAFLKPAQQQSPLTAHHPQSQPMQPTSTPTTAPMFAHATAVPFTFAQSADMSPAFDFAGNALSSPLTGDSARQHSYLSPPMWQQQQQQQPPPQRQQHIADNPVYTTNKYSQPAFAAPPPHHSPTSLNNGRASSSSSHSSPEPPVASKKRKLSSDDDDLESPSSSKKEKGQPPKKTAHNMIEKRYRTNLNDKIAALRDSVPSLRVMSRPNGTEEDDDPEDLEGLTPAHKLNKATVLSKATEYIRHLEKRNKRMADEIVTLQARLDGYEKMTMSGQMNLHTNHAGTPDGSRYQEDPFAPAHGMPMHGPTQGMIPVPENIAALQRGLPPQQHYAPAYPQYPPNTRPNTGPPMVNARRTGGMVGKLMVGSLAGLMVLDGVVEHQQSHGEPADRGLFAFPVHLATSILAPRASFGVSTTHIPLAKLILVFGAVFWLIAPWLHPQAKPKKKKKNSPAVQLKAAPSLDSPLEVRQNAWLTAIQTVWVPQHNLLLEIAALGLKTLKLSTRKIIGWRGYVYLTGLTKEQEDARVKAWEIALDAQLTGGDAEISKSRLLLTLLASGTLPDTPARLMLKALHVRVLLWEIANTGHGSWWTMDEFSAKLARSYWNMARSEHRIASNTASKQDKSVGPLPDHLAALIEKECDDVLVPAIVQRAYDLAWNPAGTEKTADDISMDSVVEDSAISSPLDALAAWYSGVVLKKALASTLATKKSVLKDSVVSDLALAVQSAPPNSQAHLRALVAQAVVLDDNRTERIGLALQALPSPPPLTDAGFMNFIGTARVAEDICDALTLAKCLSLLETSNSTARLRAIFRINGFYLRKSTITLLSLVAGHKILTRFMEDASLQMETGTGLERLASSLRVWVRHGSGKQSGLSNKIRSRIVERCLDATKTLVGLAEQKDEAYIDDGYASASVKDD